MLILEVGLGLPQLSAPYNFGILEVAFRLPQLSPRCNLGGNPKPGCVKPACLQFFRLFCALLRSFADMLGRSRMSGRRTSGSSRPSLGVQVLDVFSFIS